MVVGMSTHTVERTSLAAIRDLAEPIVASIVWATATTVGPDARPRSRVVHPVLDWADPPRGWITSRPTPLKRRHLADHPFLTLSFWSPAQDCVFVDCDATWTPAELLADRWERIATTSPPVGFDPATIWPDGPTTSDFAVIDLRPHRIRVVQAARLAAGEPQPLWSAPDD
jgi:hypothetical protein